MDGTTDPRPTIGAVELVAAVIRPLLPTDTRARLYLGGFPAGRSDRSIALVPVGGRDTVRVLGTRTPRFVTERVAVRLRDLNRAGSTDWKWLRRWTERIRHELDAVRAPETIRVAEVFYLDPDVHTAGLEEQVTSTYGPDLWMDAGGTPPRFVVAPQLSDEQERRAGAEVGINVKYHPRRSRPLTAPLGPWAQPLRTAGAAAEVVHSTVIPPAGGRGRVLAGGRVTCGTPQPVMLPADSRNPGDTGNEGNPLEPREDGLLWVNRNVPVTTPRGDLDMFASGTSGNEVRDGIDIEEAPVLKGPDRLRIELSAAFSPEQIANYGFLLTHPTVPVRRYVLRLRDATPSTSTPHERYDWPVPWQPEDEPTTGEQFDWALADLRLFRLEAAPSVVPADATWRVRWLLRWQGGTVPIDHPQSAAEQVSEPFTGPGSHVLPLAVAERPAGGTLEQVAAVSTAEPLARNEGFAVPVAASGLIIHGEDEPTGDEGQVTGRAFHGAHFSEAFG